MEALDLQLRELIEAHQSFFRLTDNGKIECTLNGHTLPARLDAVSSFIKGAKFQKLSRRQTADQALQKYEPFIVQSNNFPLMLYCALTGQLIDKSVEAVKKHMKGKKFQRAKDRFAADDLELKPEPTLESFGIKTSKGAAANQQQQQQPQQQEEEGAAAAAGLAGNGAAPGSEDEPGFWVPEGVESGSSSSGESEEEGDGDADGAKPGSSGSSSSSGDGEGSDADAADADMETGPAGDSGDDPMEEDPKPAAAAAAKASKAGSSKGSSKGGAKAQQKQKHEASKGKGAAQNGAAAAGAAKKRNAQRPSAAKKARR